MGSAINELLARGVQVAPLDINSASQNQQTQAETRKIGAEQKQVEATTQQTQAQTQGLSLDNALKQRDVQARQTWQSIAQQSSIKHPDGSMSTDMPSALAKYAAAGYPEYAMKIQATMLENQKLEAETGKAQLDLAAGKTKLAGLRVGNSGIETADPQKKAEIYQGLSQQAQREGWSDQLPANPQQFAQNPNAYTDKLSDIVNSSGSKAEVLGQQKAQIEAKQAAFTQARSQFSDMLQQVKDPSQYGQVYDAMAKQYPQYIGELGLPPKGEVTSPAALQHVKEASVFTQLDPAQQQAAFTAIKAQQATAGLQGAETTRANAEATRARAEAGLANTQAGVVGQTFQQNYGVTPGGKPVTPQQGAAPTNSPVVNAPGKGELNLDSFGPWKAEPPVVQRGALNLLQNGEAAGLEGPAAARAAVLASKVDPQWKDHVQARGKLMNDVQPYVTAAATAVSHGVDLEELAKGVGNKLPQFLNTKVSNIKGQFGSEVQAEFDNRVNRYNGEIEKMMHGGVPTVSGLSEGFKSGASREKTVGQILGIVRDNNSMIKEKSDVINNQYNKQLGGNIIGGGIDVLPKEARDVIARQSSGGKGGGKTATIDHIRGYAKQKGISEGQARKEFETSGYTVK